MTQPADPAPTSDHARHEPMLLARLAGDDLVGPQRTMVEAWLTGCADCRRLLDDLHGLRRSLAADLPDPIRRQDFRLAPAQVRGRSSWSPLGWLGRLMATDSPLISPLAGAAMVLGLVLLAGSAVLGGAWPFASGGAAQVLTTVGAAISAPGPSASAGGAGGGATAPSELPRAVSSASAAASAPSASAAPADQGAPSGSRGSPAPSASTSSAAPPEATAEALGGYLGPTAAGSGPGPGPAALTGLGILLLGLGALVVGGRWLTRRRAA